MKGVSNESTNTDKMRQHNLAKQKHVGDSMKHEDGDLMVCTDLVDQSRTCALNGCSDFVNILAVLQANPDDKALASDVDPQLIMKVFFKEKVNVSNITLRFNKPPSVSEDDSEIYSKPKKIKLFPNAPDLDFGDIEDQTAAAEKIVENDAAEEAKITCIGSKFQRLESISVFVESAIDEEATRSFINRLSIVGHQTESYHASYK
mmetsp:Transcript_82961/g.130832  ORF Transcript_82961/g.130832 Transcript_82961/m.130832 type:complete len:204 (+) Transcript_82961:80-691(+)